ncbi:DUF6440 family protein [Peptacetobacter sp. AB845]|uniref:DUF6440 family protein n=1 Tax=Peptacetobacter sp. AB845 TaxID=3388429 RepID=UPI0039C903A6
MEWKKIITAIAALMLAYSLVGCNDTVASEVEEAMAINKFEEIHYERIYPGTIRIVKDKETGVEYIVIRGDREYSITPRLKGAE